MTRVLAMQSYLEVGASNNGLFKTEKSKDNSPGNLAHAVSGDPWTHGCMGRSHGPSYGPGLWAGHGPWAMGYGHG